MTNSDLTVHEFFCMQWKRMGNLHPKAVEKAISFSKRVCLASAVLLVAMLVVYVLLPEGFERAHMKFMYVFSRIMALFLATGLASSVGIMIAGGYRDSFHKEVRIVCAMLGVDYREVKDYPYQVLTKKAQTILRDKAQYLMDVQVVKGVDAVTTTEMLRGSFKGYHSTFVTWELVPATSWQRYFKS